MIDTVKIYTEIDIDTYEKIYSMSIIKTAFFYFRMSDAIIFYRLPILLVALTTPKFFVIGY